MAIEHKIVYMLEDDSDDRYITTSTIEESGLPIDVKFFSKSYQFLEFLSTAKKSSLILVDYNSNPDNGLAVLKKIKEMDVHKGTPLIILSDSSVSKDKDECYALGASSFIQKPSRLKKTKEVIQLFFSYWITIAEA